MIYSLLTIALLSLQAIASMGGAFLECNALFAQLSDYTKQELCALTIFNLTARQDLQAAFDQISQLLSPPLSSAKQSPIKPISLQGTMKNGTEHGLSVLLVKGEDGIAKCFCVTLVKNQSSPFGSPTQIPVSFEALTQTGGAQQAKPKEATSSMNVFPAFTSG
jgi:hypothetical protein